MDILFIVGYAVVLIGLPIWLWWYTKRYQEIKVKDCGVGIFGSVSLVKKHYGEVWLRMCGVTQGVDARTFVEDKSYWHVSAKLITENLERRAKNQKEGAVLYLGLGGGTIPALVAQKLPEVRQLVIEIDPKVIDVVREDFGLKDIPSIEIRQADAFELVKNKFDFGEQFDLVLVDVFSDYASLDEPGSLQSEFMDYYHGMLKSGGKLMVNQPSHTEAAKESVRKTEKLLGKRYGEVKTVFVHDKKRGFRNTLVIV